MIKIKHGKLVQIINTPPALGRLRGMNRAARRQLVYANRGRRLFNRILKLRKDMLMAGIKPPKPPKSTRAKALSGYYGQLLQTARREV